MATNTTGIEKKVEIDRKENLRKHQLYWIVRRTQDIILSLVALVVLSPVMLATAVAIVVDDPSAGPIFCFQPGAHWPQRQALQVL